MGQRILTGIKASGDPHLGNYIGAVRPALELSKQPDTSAFLFIADHHALTSTPSPSELKASVYKITACWLACGLEPKTSFFYRQSDIPELFELSWILACCSPKGLMNRAHSYKALRDKNRQTGKKDPDDGVNMGLYSYPILMSADILLFSPEYVPVGRDQLQHLEMTRDIAQKFNLLYQTDLLRVPKPLVKEENVLPGLDGRKMSKSYKNEIPLFLESAKLRKLVRKIKTDSSPPDQAKDPEKCLIFETYKHFASQSEQQELRLRYKEGIGWGEAKDILFETLDTYFREKKQLYDHYMGQKSELEKILKTGGERLREEARPFLNEIKACVGFF